MKLRTIFQLVLLTLFIILTMGIISWMFTTSFFILPLIENGEETVRSFSSFSASEENEIFSQRALSRAGTTQQAFQRYKDILRTVLMLSGVLLAFVILRVAGILLTMFNVFVPRKDNSGNEEKKLKGTDKSLDQEKESGSFKEAVSFLLCGMI